MLAAELDPVETACASVQRGGGGGLLVAAWLRSMSGDERGLRVRSFDRATLAAATEGVTSVPKCDRRVLDDLFARATEWLGRVPSAQELSELIDAVVDEDDANVRAGILALARDERACGRPWRATLCEFREKREGA